MEGIGVDEVFDAVAQKLEGEQKKVGENGVDGKEGKI